MKKILSLATLVAVSMAGLSSSLIEKYSIKIVSEGQAGTEPKIGDDVQMHYEGKLTDGTKFDSSFDRGQPLPLKIGKGQVIKCWDEVGVQLNVGSKVEVLCPSETAYGSRGIGPIPANSDLIFIIERIS